MKMILVLCGVLALVAPAFGDVILPNDVGVFVGNWTPSETGPEFFNNTSSDGVVIGGRGCGVGYYIAGLMRSNCGYISGDPNGGPNAILPYLGDKADPLNAPVDFYFGSGLEEHATLKVELAGWRDFNEFGVYFRDGVGGIASMLELFDGSDSAVMRAPFDVTGQTFGFYYTNKKGQTFFTESSLNDVTEQRLQHFALFRELPVSSGTDLRATRYWIGAEDTVGGMPASDRDFNDMVVMVETVPEPGTLMLLGIGLLALGAIRRRGVPRLRG